MTDYAQKWGDKAAAALVGRRIVAVRYLFDDEMEMLAWDNRSLVIQLDDGTLLYPSRDDEGNGAGALFTNIADLETIPTI